MNAKTDPRPKVGKKGLVMVNTGNGKGKTTAALGVLFRALGHGLHPCVIQFMKRANAKTGEVKMARRMGIEWHILGDGFSRRSKNIDQMIAKARAAWDFAREKIIGGAYDLVVLDEFTYLLALGWLDTEETLVWLREHKPASMHLVITGRDAPQALIAFADLVTEMALVKHPHSLGAPAQLGIEY
jgi:cob(I)alamin adenosyltransferase